MKDSGGLGKYAFAEKQRKRRCRIPKSFLSERVVVVHVKSSRHVNGNCGTTHCFILFKLIIFC